MIEVDVRVHNVSPGNSGRTHEPFIGCCTESAPYKNTMESAWQSFRGQRVLHGYERSKLANGKLLSY